MNFHCRHKIDDFTTVAVYRNDKAIPEERYVCLFIGQYYTHYDEKTGLKKSLCIRCDPSGETYHWDDVRRTKGLGVLMHWVNIPQGVKDLIYFEYRRDIPNYGVRSYEPKQKEQQ